MVLRLTPSAAAISLVIAPSLMSKTISSSRGDSRSLFPVLALARIAATSCDRNRLPRAVRRTPAASKSCNGSSLSTMPSTPHSRTARMLASFHCRPNTIIRRLGCASFSWLITAGISGWHWLLPNSNTLTSLPDFSTGPTPVKPPTKSISEARLRISSTAMRVHSCSSTTAAFKVTDADRLSMQNHPLRTNVLQNKNIISKRT